MKYFVVILLLLITCTGFAQKLTRKEKRAARRGESIMEPTTLDPGSSNDREFAPSGKVKERKMKKSNGPTYNSQKDFEDRMAARAKTNRYNERMLNTPQYSDPSYFGHKHKPKRHSAKKMKYCKECGIRH